MRTLQGAAKVLAFEPESSAYNDNPNVAMAYLNPDNVSLDRHEWKSLFQRADLIFALEEVHKPLGSRLSILNFIWELEDNQLGSQINAE